MSKKGVCKGGIRKGMGTDGGYLERKWPGERDRPLFITHHVPSIDQALSVQK